MKRFAMPVLAALVAFGLALSIYYVFYVSELQANGNPPLYWNHKIFYFHVPFAFMLFAAVFACGIPAAIYLKTRDPRYDDVAAAAAELAVVFGAIVLVTGSVWARAAWGVWWTWEMRLTTSLLLWLIMMGYVLVRRFGGAGAERLSAGLAVFAMIDVPLVYFSVKFWNFLHPKAEVVSTLQGSMKTTFRMTSVTIIGLFVLLLVARVAQLRAVRQLREARERALDAGILEP
jgi:heme exporter protein C